MRELEEQLRKRSHQSLPESAPEGSFEALRARMEQPKRRKWALLLLLLAGLLFGGWWMVDATGPVTETLASPPELPEAGGKRSTQPTVRPDADARQPPSTILPPAPRAPETPATRTEPVQLETPIPVGKNVGTQPTGPAAPVAALGPAPALRRNEASPSLTSLTIGSVSFGNAASRLPVPQAGVSARTGFWDVSLSAYPTPLRTGGYFTGLTAEADPNFPLSGTFFVVDGSPVMLYGSTYHAVEGRSLHPIVQLRINRQTAGVLRYGVGATVFTEINNQVKQAAALAGEEPTGYFAAYRERTHIGLASAHVGLTLRREHRLQPWIDLGLQVGIASRSRTDRYIVTRDRPTGWLQSTEISTYNYLEAGGPALAQSLEAGLQYRLGGNWSAGINVGTAPGGFAALLPTLGFEIRYRP